MSASTNLRSVLRSLAFMNFADSISVGVVVIGRNEGERLRRCFESVRAEARLVVYVDSGSTDGSVEMARSAKVDVVELDMRTPFTAARARNAGFARLREVAPELDFVQFVDGDCELMHGWLPAAVTFLAQDAEVACVCGRLRERFPQRSVYNRLCDMEWDRPVGNTDACGGIALMRTATFASVGGFRDDMVAGEEPELCLRIRDLGWKVWRLAQPMAVHDAAMLRFSQWWTRSTRSGFSYAQRISVQVGTIEPALMRQALRAWVWAAALPLVVLLGYLVWGGPALYLLLAYPLQVLRLASKSDRPWRIRLEGAFFVVLGKFPEALGLLQFGLSRRHTKSLRSFDYKS